MDLTPTSVTLHAHPAPLRIVCSPAGKRRQSAWLGGQFLGHVVERVDGTWCSKTPDEQTHPGHADMNEALREPVQLRDGVRAMLQRMGERHSGIE